MLTSLFGFIQDLSYVLGAALRLEPDLLLEIASEPERDLLIMTICILAGASLMAGQSVVLFVNRVSPLRFIYSLLLYGLVFTVGLGLWASSAWLSAVLLFGANQPLDVALRIVGLGCAPLVFGFLIAMIYFGSSIEWFLRGWCLLITIGLVESSFAFSLWQALVCGIIGWLMMQLVTYMIQRPLSRLRDWLWRAVTGTQFDTNEQDLLKEATIQLRSRLQAARQAE
jgi:hypothetical protein